jgi:cell wall-associated NlpC family hydrolase
MKKFIIIFFLFVFTKSKSQDINLNTLDNFVNKWLGKPYRFGGVSERGIDCSAFVQKYIKYIYNFDIPRTCVKQFNYLSEVSFNKLKIGDILYFFSKKSPSKWHCGIYLGNEQFIHAANHKEGVRISCLSDSIYLKNLKGIRRL